MFPLYIHALRRVIIVIAQRGSIVNKRFVETKVFRE